MIIIPEIIKYPNPQLRKESIYTRDFGVGLKRLVDTLILTMYHYDAAGISSIQIGSLESVFVVDGMAHSKSETADPIAFINPLIINYSEDKNDEDEGCLSFPGQFINVSRSDTVDVIAQDIDGELFEVSASGFYARVIQHEYDHLSGKMMIDYTGRIKRDLIDRKLRNIRF